VSSREIPVAPPSMKWLGNKKLFNPNPADNTPNEMNTQFLIKYSAFDVFDGDLWGWISFLPIVQK
jgi:hypothetical protein